MKLKCRQQAFALFFASTVLLSNFAFALAMSVDQDVQRALDGQRAFNSKSNNIKKAQMVENKQVPDGVRPTSIIKEKGDKDDGFQWSNLLNIGLKLLSSGTQSSGGTSNAIDKMDKISQITSGEFSWTKIISLGLQLVLSFFGNDNVDIGKMDPGSPIEAFLTAAIAYFTGSSNPQEVSVMAKQATELWNIVISLLDALRTSFSQRSFEARAIGSNDIVADAAVASTSMIKSFVKTYATGDDICMQKYVCEANKDCADETSESGYLFCQMSTYALSYILEGRSYTPFEIISDAGRRGRVGENCSEIYKECQEKYF